MFGYVAYICVAIFYVFMSNVDCANILAVFPYPGPQQYIAAHTYLRELAVRGHNITLIVHKIDNVDLTPFHVITVEYPGFNKLMSVAVKSKMEVSKGIIENIPSNVVTLVMEHPEVKDLMTNGTTFDMVIIDTLHTSALYGLGRHFQAHLLGLSSGPTDQQVDNLVGNESPASLVPVFLSGFRVPMSFLERINNLSHSYTDWFWFYIFDYIRQRWLFNHYFSHLGISLDAAKTNFSLVLANQHITTGFPRPYTTNMIEVGGMHITENFEPLPSDLQKFIDNAPNGVIYFSMGSNIVVSEMLEKSLAKMMKFFKAIDMHVLWKFEVPDMVELPSNVFAREWFPQRAVLAHPNVKLFITQGGYLSAMEAVYHAKPVVGLPTLYAEYINMGHLEEFGMGISAPFKRFDKTNLTAILDAIMRNKAYAMSAKRMSRRFMDRPAKPLDTAIFWTEYILRHNGAEYMRTPVRHMSFMAYYNLDLWGLAALITFIKVFLFLRIVNNIFIAVTANLPPPEELQELLEPQEPEEHPGPRAVRASRPSREPTPADLEEKARLERERDYYARQRASTTPELYDPLPGTRARSQQPEQTLRLRSIQNEDVVKEEEVQVEEKQQQPQPQPQPQKRQRRHQHQPQQQHGRRRAGGSGGGRRRNF